MLHRRSRWNLQEHLSALDSGFERCLKEFESRRIFSGPSVYFYEEVVKLVRSAASLSELASSDRLAELAYAALTSWGMHRMGERVATKLTEFSTFRGAVRGLIEPAAALSKRRITDLSDGEAGIVTERLADLVERPGISASGSPLVANAKILHFLLPDLVPPIDRTYTGRFFYGLNAGMVLPGGTRAVFEFVFPQLCRLACRHSEEIRSATRRSYLCQGEAKVLDNAPSAICLHASQRSGPSKSMPRPARREHHEKRPVSAGNTLKTNLTEGGARRGAGSGGHELLPTDSWTGTSDAQVHGTMPGPGT
jgi:hypothetical protein